jgi:DNA polymerase V
MSAMDALNERFGRNAVTVACAVRRPGPSAHASKQERRSPRYTTRLDEIAVASAQAFPHAIGPSVKDRSVGNDK